MRGLKDRTVLVTGAANGIGAATARRLAEEGCAVGILDVDIAAGEEVAGEIVGKGVILNTICPGPTDTAILRSFLEGPEGARIAEALRRAIPMRRLGVPEDYPGLIAFLLSDDAAYMTGQTISVSGGLTMHG